MPADSSVRAPSPWEVGYVMPPVRRTLRRANIDAYRSASGDHNRIHHDDEFAAATQFGGVIAHGMLTLAMISEMMAGAYGTCWLQTGALRVRFRGAAYPGDALEAVGSVTKSESVTRSESVANGSRLTCNVELLNVDNGSRIITGSAIVVLGSADTRKTAQ